MNMFRWASVGVMVVAMSLGAAGCEDEPDVTAQVQPGMSLDEVVAILGEPIEQQARQTEAVDDALAGATLAMSALRCTWDLGGELLELELLNGVVVSKIVRRAS